MDDHQSPNSHIHTDDLTWREREVLSLLAERLTNREIAERLVLAESTVKDYVGRILSKLYVKNRRQAVRRAKELDLFDAGQPTAAAQRINIPAAPTAFIGRRDELKAIKQQLKKTRLLTLSGPGGMGKTRLAMKTAEEVSDDFPDGVFFVPLASIRLVDDIVQTIAEAVKFPIPTHENPKHQLLRYLQKKRLLLVMDNFEHLMGGSSIVGEVLQTAPGVKILATSREKLNLFSETNLTIGGIKIVTEPASGNLEDNDAVALFLQSANKVRMGFDPTPDELAKIADICEYVEGMPLAIELAASWLHILSLLEIEEELKKGLDILAAEARDVPGRHQSIRAVFDQSWSLLGQDEQEILKRLSIFRGGLTRQAAHQVAGASLSQIAGLVNKSILMPDPDTGRFDIHELLRQYAQEWLENTPQDSDSVKEAYAGYFADLMQNKWQQISSSDQNSALAEIEADIENIRTTWRYWLAHKNSAQMLKFIHSFLIIYWVRGWFRGAIDLFADCVETLAEVKPDIGVQVVQAAAMAHLGFFMSWVGRAEEGYQLCEESVEKLEKLDAPIELAMAFQGLTLAAYYLDRPDAEKIAAYRFLELVEDTDHKWLLAYGLWLVNLAEYRADNFPESKRLLEAAIKVSSEISDMINLGLCFTSLGGFAIIDREYTEAKKYYQRCLQISKQLGFRWLSSNAIKYLGQIALLTGEIDEAHQHFTQSLIIAYELGVDRDIANHLYDFARLRVAQNKLEQGVELLSVVLQQPASNLSRSEGGSIADNARELLTDLRERLSEETFNAALERGERLEKDKIVIELIGIKQ